MPIIRHDNRYCCVARKGTIENRLTRCLWTSGPKSMEVYDVSSDKMLADFRIICSTSTSRSLKLIEFVECPWN